MPQYTPPLPTWATTLEHVQHVKGSDLKPGDIIHFAQKAWPRLLWKQLDDKTWSCTVQKRYAHERGQAEIEPYRYYVVQRQPTPVLEYIRVGGELLEIGDVVDFTPRGEAKRHMRIEEIAESEHREFGQGKCRDALLRNVDDGSTMSYTFRNFSLLDFTVVGGPKLDAARGNPALIKKAPVGYHWLGGRKVPA